MKVIMPLFAAQRAEAFYTDLFFGHLGASLPRSRCRRCSGRKLSSDHCSGRATARCCCCSSRPSPASASLRPAWLLGGLPTLLLNLVSSFFATHTTDYHYQGFVLPFVICAAISGGAWLTARLEQAGVRRATALATPTVLAAAGVWLLPYVVPAFPRMVTSPLPERGLPRQVGRGPSVGVGLRRRGRPAPRRCVGLRLDAIAPAAERPARGVVLPLTVRDADPRLRDRGRLRRR
ncbi:MAG: DUF2079 domain-containing protein [Gammaproteobacteria bacterium]|nr:DUF2079 domain-containing protein [Gammaproteobacteria bacterium]